MVKLKADLRIAFGQFDDRSLLFSFVLFGILLLFLNLQWTKIEFLIVGKLNALVPVFMVESWSNSDKEFDVRFVLRIRWQNGSTSDRLAP